MISRPDLVREVADRLVKAFEADYYLARLDRARDTGSDIQLAGVRNPLAARAARGTRSPGPRSRTPAEEGEGE